MLPLELLVGQAIGPFKLGQSIYQTIGQIRSLQLQCSVSWDASKASSRPVLLTLKEPPLKLLFEGISQLLCLIELSDPREWLLYKGKPLEVDALPISAASLHKRFGPTFPLMPHPDPGHAGESVMWWPGVAFVLIDSQVHRVIVTNTLEADITSAAELFKQALHLPSPSIAHSLTDVTVRLGTDDKPTSMELTAPLGKCKVTIGITQHDDIIADLGPASRIFYKEDNRLDIHSHSSPQLSATTDQDSPTHYFLNYFQYGVDFLLHGTEHTLLKIVLHANIPGEVLFGRYHRCNWTLYGEGSSKGISSRASSAVIFKYLHEGSSSKADAPTEQLSTFKLDRTADLDEQQIGKTTELIGLPRIVLEKTQSNNIETVWLF